MTNKHEKRNEQIFDAILSQALAENMEQEIAQLEAELEQAPPVNINPKIKSAILQKAEQSEHPRWQIVLRRVACWAAILLMASIIFTHPTTKAALHTLSMAIFSDHTEYGSDVKGIVTLDNFNYFLHPEFIVDGYRLSESHYGYGTAELTYVTNNSSDSYTVYYTLDDATAFLVDNEHSIQSDENVNGMTYIYHQSTDDTWPSFLFWMNEGYTFRISAQFDFDTLVQIAESRKIP